MFESDPLIGVYCGSTGPPAITSASNALYVRFVSDSSEGGTGFTLNYVAVNRTYTNVKRARDK